MNRRDFAASSAAALLAVAQGVRPAQAQVFTAGSPFRDLPELRSENGQLSTELTMAAADLSFGGRSLRLATYNGEMPGPVMRVRPGDKLSWVLKNRLTPLGLPPGEKELPEELAVLNYTNVHTHGLQVSPQDGSDNVYLTIKPGEDYAYSY